MVDQGQQSSAISRQQPSRFYHHSTVDEEDVWQPGESLPRTVSDMDEFKSELHSMFSTMQAAITSQIANLKDSMSNLEQRLSDVEAQVASISASSVTPQVSTPTCSSDSYPLKRKQNTPLHIQVSFVAVEGYVVDNQLVHL